MMKRDREEYKWVFHMAMVLAIISLVFVVFTGAIFLYFGLSMGNDYSRLSDLSGLLRVANYSSIISIVLFGVIFPLMLLGFYYTGSDVVGSMPYSYLVAGCILIFVGLLYGNIPYNYIISDIHWDIGMIYIISFLTTSVGGILTRVGIMVIIVGILKGWPPQNHASS